MARASKIQNAFNAGELSPLLLGRQDLDKYGRGLFTCFNAIPLTQGGWTRRPGTAFLHQCKFHDKLARLFPFQYSVSQTYVLEFGHSYIRFYTSHGILAQATQAITAATKASVCVVTYSGADTYANADRVHIAGVGGMAQLDGREFVVTNVNTTANTFELYDSDGVAVNSTSYDTYTAGGTIAEIFEVVTAFADTELAEVRITQSADTLFITHPDHAPQKLVRNSALSWTLSDLVFVDGPYDVPNTTATTLAPSAATGTATIVASAATGINSDLGFLATDVGRLVRMQQGTVWGWARITTVGSTVSVTADIQSTFTSTVAKTNWRLGVWSDTTGWPTCSTFFEDRLFFAGAEVYPQRLDGSKTSNYFNFAPSDLATGAVAADNAIAYTLNSDDVNAVRWMSPNEKGLLVGTSRGEWQVKASALNEALAPTNISAKPSTHYGSAAAAPVNAGKAVLFIQRAARKLRELAYVFEVDGFKAPDMTLLAEHVTRSGLTQLAYQEQPQAIVWALRGDGRFAGQTYERDQDVVAWHRHALGGSSSADGTAIPIVESMATVPSPDSTRDEAYMVVQRYIHGGTKRYVEYLSKIWEQEDEQEDAFYTDCGLTVTNGSPSASVTGLWAWEGQTLNAYVDGSTHIDVTVTNGKVTLERTGTVVTLGYFYNSDGQTMPLDGGSQDGSSQGKIKRIHSIGFWLIDTLGLKYGPSVDSLTEFLTRQWGDDYGTATPLFTGVARERFEGDYDKLGQIYWRADGPFPATVLALMPQFETSDDS